VKTRMMIAATVIVGLVARQTFAGDSDQKSRPDPNDAEIQWVVRDMGLRLDVLDKQYELLSMRAMDAELQRLDVGLDVTEDEKLARKREEVTQRKRQLVRDMMERNRGEAQVLTVQLAELRPLPESARPRVQAEAGQSAAPANVTKYDKMEKKQLEEELKKLQKDVLVAEQTAKEACDQAGEAKEAYKSASDEQKPDALLRMIGADAKSRKPDEDYRQARENFEDARRAYLNLLVAEQK